MFLRGADIPLWCLVLANCGRVGYGTAAAQHVDSDAGGSPDGNSAEPAARDALPDTVPDTVPDTAPDTAPDTFGSSVAVDGADAGGTADQAATADAPIAPVTLGLVGYWKFDETSGTTVADSSSTGAHGIAYNDPAISLDTPGGSSNRRSRIFDGSSTYVRVQRVRALEPAAVTASIWVKRDGPQGWPAKLIEKAWHDHGSPSYLSYQLGINPTANDSTQIQFINSVSGDNHGLVSPPGVLPDLTWTHVVGTYDPAGTAPQKRLYINGALVASATLTSAMVYDTTSTGDLYLGYGPSPNNYHFKGWLYDARVYNRALSAAEIESIYRSR